MALATDESFCVKNKFNNSVALIIIKIVNYEHTLETSASVHLYIALTMSC